MSVNEIQALAQRFADAFDQRDIKTVLEMLSDDVEVIDHVPYRFDGKPLFCQVSQRGVRGYRLDELRLSAAIMPRVQRYCRDRECLRHVHGRHQGRQGLDHPWPNHPGLRQTGQAVEDCELPLLAHASYALKGDERIADLRGGER